MSALLKLSRSELRGLGITSVVLILIWGGSHLFSLSWGLPNPQSFAADSIPVKTTAKEAMGTCCYVYPPLQYLLLDSILPTLKNTSPKNQAVIVDRNSRRIVDMRLVTAIMTLMSSLLVAYATWWLFRSFWGAGIAGGLFLLAPSSLYYSHTTNMDQPYVLWWSASLVALMMIWERLGKRDVWNLAYYAVFAFFAALAFCTKDQVYALYFLPLIATVFCDLRRQREKRWKWFFSVSSIGCGVFVVGVVGIYLMAGGMEVARNHFNWITGKGTAGFEQVAGTWAGHLSLIGKSIVNLCFCLDWPIVLLTCFAGAMLVIHNALFEERIWRNCFRLAFFTGLCLLSYELFFVQVTRFSHVRYYLPILPLFCCFIGGVVGCLLWSKKFVGIAGCVVLVVIQIAIATQFVLGLSNDPRSGVAEFIKENAYYKGRPLPIATDSLREGQVYMIDNGKSIPFKTMRDWGKTSYGFLSESRKGIEIKPLALTLVSPAFLVVEGNLKQDEATLLERNGYRLAESFKPAREWIPTCFENTAPDFQVFFLNSKQPVFDEGIEEEMKRMPLEEQLIRIQAFVNPFNFERQKKIIGKYISDFHPLNMKEYRIFPQVVALIAQCYSEAGRHENAKKAMEWLNLKRGG